MRRLTNDERLILAEASRIRRRLSEGVEEYIDPELPLIGSTTAGGSRLYLAVYNRDWVQVLADTTFKAQEEARMHFQGLPKNRRKKIKGWDVTTMLHATVDGVVTHTPDF